MSWNSWDRHPAHLTNHRLSHAAPIALSSELLTQLQERWVPLFLAGTPDQDTGIVRVAVPMDTLSIFWPTNTQVVLTERKMPSLSREQGTTNLPVLMPAPRLTLLAELYYLPMPSLGWALRKPASHTGGLLHGWQHHKVQTSPYS